MSCGAEDPTAKRAKVDEAKEAKEEEDPLVRRREELVLMDANARANARAKGKELVERMVREAKEKAERLEREAEGERRGLRRSAKAEGKRLVREAKKRAILESDRNIREARLSFGQELRSVCRRLEAKNQKNFGGRRLPRELWQKIVDENLHQNDLPALAMTCRFFRDATKDFGWKLETNLTKTRLLELQKSGRMPSPSLGWYRWVCDTFEILPGFEDWRHESLGYKRVKGAVYEGDLVNYAVFQGSVEILRWLMEEKGWELNWETGRWTGMGGSIEVLEFLEFITTNGLSEFLLEMGYRFTSYACHGAARGGHLEALKFLRGLDRPCRWDERTCADAARGGHLDVLKWARSQDPPCPWDGRTCADAAKGGHLDILKWARSQDPPCPWDEWTCYYAARGGHLDVLKWARSEDPPCPWDGRTCEEAAKGGRLDVLKWARSQDPPCPWDEVTCADAAREGHIEILKWLRDQDPPCPWHVYTCLNAAQGGHLEALKFLRGLDPPCPWDDHTCSVAAGGGEPGHFEVGTFSGPALPLG